MLQLHISAISFSNKLIEHVRRKLLRIPTLNLSSGESGYESRRQSFGPARAAKNPHAKLVVLQLWTTDLIDHVVLQLQRRLSILRRLRYQLTTRELFVAIALQQALSPTRSAYGRYGPEPGGSRRLPSRQAPAHTRKQTNKQTDKASLSNHNKQAHKHTIETFNQHVLTLAMEKSKGGLAFALQHKAVKAPMTKKIRPLKDDDKDHEAVVATLK